MMKRSTFHNTQIRSALTGIAMLIAVMAAPHEVVGQTLENYKLPNGSIVRSQGITYSSIEFTGNAVPSWRFTGSGGEDDNRSYPIAIGFDFWYVGTRYTTFSVSTNGFIDFSTAANDGGPATNQYGSTDNDLSQAAANRTMPLTIAPFYYDQTTDSTNGSQGLIALAYGIKYQTSGAPGNRVLTVEWIRSQPWYTDANGRPSFNYQLKLYERTGVIEFVYGTMNIGTFSFNGQDIVIVKGYTCGMNGTSVSSPPTPAQLLVQQGTNSGVFSNAGATGQAGDGVHTLNTLPESNSRIRFMPPVPNGSPSDPVFNGVTQTSMTVNWTDNASNELGYVIYRSDDGGSTYNFITQLPTNSHAYTQNGLLAGTTYYWRIYAVSEGALSLPLDCAWATELPGAFISVRDGAWNTGSTWQGGIVPTSSADVTIADGTTVQLDVNATVNSVTVGGGTSGTLLIGSSTTPRTLNVVGMIEVKSGGTFKANPAYAATHTLNTTGNIQNAGTFDLAPDSTSRMQAIFNKAGQQTINGSGPVTRVHTVTLNMGASRANILDVFAENFTSRTPGFLAINNGTFNLATSGPAGTTFTIFSGNMRIPTSGALRINHPSAVVATIGGSVTVAGEIRLNGGVLQIGNAANHNLIIDGGRVELSGSPSDQISIAGRFEPANTYALTDLTIAGGSLVVGRVGSTSATNAPFTMNVPGSRFVMSDGSIIIQQSGGGTSTLGYENRNYYDYAVTGGRIQFGNTTLTPSSQTMNVNTTIPMYDFVVNSSNATARLVNSNITVLNDVVITLGTLNANSLHMNVGGRWRRSASGTSFIPTGGRVTFDGSGAQAVENTETFNRFAVRKPAGTALFQNNVTVADSFALAQGTLDIMSTTLTLNGPVTGGGQLTCTAASRVNYMQAAAGQYVLPADYGTLAFSTFAKVLPQSTVGIRESFLPAGTGHTITNNTIDYKLPGSQTVSPFVYNDLVLSAGGTKTLAGAVTVNGSMTIASGVTLNNAGYAAAVLGPLSHNGTHAASSGAIVLQGAAQQPITGTGAFNNLTVNNAQGAVLTRDLTVNGALTLTAGIIDAGTFTVSAQGGVSRTNGHVNGRLARTVGTGDPVVQFPIGDAVSYAGIAVTFTGVGTAGTVTALTTAGDHPQLSDASSTFDVTDNVNRYWTISNGGVACTNFTIAFTYSASDLDIPNTYTTFAGGFWNGTTWTYPATSGRSASGATMSALTAYGDFVFGNGISSGMYQTNGSGPWNDRNTWLRYNGTTWVLPTVGQGTPTNASQTITINSGHTVTITADVSVDETLVESGGQVIVNSGRTLTIEAGAGTDLMVNGILQNTGTLNVRNGATVSVGNGGRYVHAMAGAARIALPTATWDANSTCEITGATTSANSTFTNTLRQAFGHFTWNSASQSAASNLAASLANVRGNLSIAQTNGQQVVLYGNQTATTTIGGSLIVTGGVMVCKNNSNNASITVGGNVIVDGGTLQLGTGGIMTMNVAGDAVVSGGTLDLASGAARDTVKIMGNYTQTGGTLQESGSVQGTVVFSGTGVQVFNSGGTVSGQVNYIVAAGATLQLPPTTVVTGNSFTLRDGGTLAIQADAGIMTAGNMSGNVQTTTRVFGLAANYIYSGNGMQNTGNALPSSVSKLIIIAPNGTVTQTAASTTVTDELQLTAGTYAVASNTLILNNLITTSGGTLSSGATGTVVYNKQSAGQAVIPMRYGNLTFSNYPKVLPSSGTVQIAGVFSPGSAASHTVTNSTIEYTGTGQSVSAFMYNNLIVGGASASSTNSFDVLGLLTINSSLTLNGTTVVVNAGGGVANNDSVTGAGKIVLASGALPHVLTGVGHYTNLELNDPLGAVAPANIIVSGLLQLTNGILTVDPNFAAVMIGPGSVSRTNGHVNGKLRKPVAVNASPSYYYFEIGDENAFTPASITFNSVTVAGTVTVNTTPGKHPYEKFSGLDGAKNVNRYWTVSGGGGLTYSKYDIKFDFVNADVDPGANPAAFFAKRFSGMWYAANTVLRNSNWILSQNYRAFGTFLVGELSTVIYWTDAIGDHLWSTPDNWSSNSLPTAMNDVMLDGTDPATINVDLDLSGSAIATCKNLSLQNPSLTLTINQGKVLTIAGDFNQSAGLFSTQAAFPAVTGTTTITGGVIGFDAASGDQIVPAPGSYKGLRISGGGTKTAAGSFTVDSTLTIAGGTFVLGTNTITAREHVVNTAAVTGAGRIMLANAPAAVPAHQVSGGGSFSNLELNDSKGASLIGNITVTTLMSMTSGILNTGTSVLTLCGTRTGSGMILGTVTRTHAFAPGTSYAFESPFTTIVIDSAQAVPSSMTVKTVIDSTAIVNTYMDPINRYYELSQTGGSGIWQTLRLHYLDAELGHNSETAPPLKVWRDSSTVWLRLGATSNSITDNWVQYGPVNGTGRFSLSSRTATDISLLLAANAVNPAPGDQIVYTVTYRNTGDGAATNFFAILPIPVNTLYVPGSIKLDGAPVGDAASGITINENSITIQLSVLLGHPVAPNSNGTIQYSVTVK